jgi:hypothetical protein
MQQARAAEIRAAVEHRARLIETILRGREAGLTMSEMADAVGFARPYLHRLLDRESEGAAR